MAMPLSSAAERREECADAGPVAASARAAQINAARKGGRARRSIVFTSTDSRGRACNPAAGKAAFGKRSEAQAHDCPQNQM